MKHVLFYEAADDYMEGARANFAAHQERFLEFATGDPFVVNGVVRSWRIREWNEPLVPD